MGFLKKLFNREKKEKLDHGTQQTREGLWNKITRAVAGRKKVDDDLLDDLEEAFIEGDVGVDTTVKIIRRLQDRVERDKYVNTDELSRILTEEVCDMIGSKSVEDTEKENDFEIDRAKGMPYVILVVGVNGVGKTTTIAKLAHQYKEAGYSVILGAADTYRAAAIEQLEIWGDRVGVPVIKQKMGSDPAAVAFDTVQAAKARNIDVVIIDTAGRLHNKVGLMNELTKIRNSVTKVAPGSQLEILQVIDGSTGQNALEQVKAFTAATDVSAIAVTKLDGTAKGGVVIAVCDNFHIPVKYIGLGEQMDDLQIFRPDEFVKSLFSHVM